MGNLHQYLIEDGPRLAYGDEAAGLLQRMTPHLARLGAEFVDTFYDRLGQRDGTAREILSALDAPGMHQLKLRQREHLDMLAGPRTARDTLLRDSGMVGRVHALVGVGGSLLVRAHALYRGLLDAVVEAGDLDGDERWRLSRIIEQRLHDDLQSQTLAAEDVMANYWRVLSRPFANAGASWPDVSDAELRVLGELPGVRAVLLMRLQRDGVLTVERSAGPAARDIAAVMQDPSTSVLIDPSTPRGQGLAALAWRTRQMQSTPAYADDPRLGFWGAHATRLGVRSTMALPVLDANGEVVACLYLYGAYANQFESAWMREFGRGLRHRWEQAWQRCGGASVYALPQGLAETYRRRMFDGGLSMYVQPVVDLRSGSVQSLEALARLCMPDGTVVGPAQFLPLLGHADLDQLFRLGLQQVLGWLGAQPDDLAGLGVSINLAPSTLLNADCVGWVSDELARHGVRARRLHIELLETQELDSPVQRHHIEQLAALGVRLSMDDLGSGYSSLERLARLPFDVIKIDQGLLASLRTQPRRVLSLVGSLIQMARDLRREAVVEGLEDDDAVEAATLLGATLGQGFGICRPMPLQQAGEWLRTFRGAMPSGVPRTPLGALAYHWRYMRMRDLPRLHTDLASCPLTDFLQAAAPDDGVVAGWHEQLHNGDDVDAAGEHLSDWLVHAITAR